MVAACLQVVSQLVVGHGQEEQVEGCELTFSCGEAPVQDRDRLGVLPRAIQRHTQSIERELHSGSQCDGSPRQRDSPLGVAPGEGTGRVDPGPIVERHRVVGQQRASLLPIGTGLLVIAEGLADDAAEVVQRVVVRVFRDEDVEVGQCLAVPAEPDQGLRPAVARTVQIRLGGEDTAEIVRGQDGLCEGQGESDRAGIGPRGPPALVRASG